MKFNIRDVLWFTLVVALATTCCLERDKRRAVTRNWVAAVNEQTKQAKERESLEREIRSLKESLAMSREDYLRLDQNYKYRSQQLVQEVAERRRLTRELERLDPDRAKPEFQPTLDLTGNR
jgi:hypothetical protein